MAVDNGNTLDIQRWNEPWGSGVWASGLNLNDESSPEMQHSDEHLDHNQIEDFTRDAEQNSDNG
ncbi:hypothetical protein [Coleofasciculus sp. H7-2]|uniref:hypothetical protein n=1 Tax=Coleofasciculus sp. H7-2 TaxID=3351545 RepID=UPI003672D2DD